MRTAIPSLSSLLAFEAASRHLSFTRAAQELDLTQTAISHQVKTLEERLGTKLFVRRRNVLQLTPAAREYLITVRESIHLLSVATDRVKGARTNDLLTITCLPTYATKCLIPVLPDFQRDFPDITLRLVTNISFDEFKRKNYDVAIRYGTGHWPELHATLLHGEEFFPVCSPTLLASAPGADIGERMASLTQIRTYFHSTYRDDWPVWLEAAGMASLDFAREAIFDIQLTSLQAAIDGVGIAIGRTPLLDDDMAAGRLVAPCAFRMRSASSYYVASPAEKMKLRKVKVFHEWLAKRLHD
jgi:LysR family glycine cleavage system transcriptional activator